MFKSIKRLLCINGWFCIEGSDINLVSHSEYGLMKKHTCRGCQRIWLNFLA